MSTKPGITIAACLAGLAMTGIAQAGIMQTSYELNYPSVSTDGKIIAFYSQSTNWGYGGMNSAYKVFVYNRERHKVLNICKNGPHFANSYCENPRISADGKWVVYEADADNLIGGITTNFFITNSSVNILACEIEESDFTSPAPGFTHKMINISPNGAQANRTCEYPVCSSNGRFVAFQTKSWNLDPDTADTNYDEADAFSGMDIYLRDRDYDGNGVFDEEGPTKTRTRRVSLDSDSPIKHCAWYPSISADGQYVAYVMKRTMGEYESGFAIGVCVRRMSDGKLWVYAPGAYNYTYEPRLSPDATHLCAQSWSEYSVARTIMYHLPDTNWWYVAPRLNNPTGTYVYACEVSTGGHYVVFSSGNTNLVPNDMNRHLDVFVRYSASGDNSAQFEIVSKSTAGEQGDAPSGDDSEYGLHYADITWDGRYVVFISAASNLVAVDTNAVTDIFIRDRWSNTTEMVYQKVGNPVFPAGAALTVSQVTNTSANFQWTAAIDDLPIWEYQLTLASSNGSTQIVVNGASTTYAGTGLRQGTAYTATLYAFDGGGHHSEALTAHFTTTGTGTGGTQINDYDGNGISELAVYDNNVGSWYAYSLQTGQATVWGRSWGWPGAETVPGDYDGDLFSDMAVYDQNTGCWYIWSEVRGLALLWARPWGWPGTETVYGDYDGDAVSDLAVYDQPSGFWYIITMGDVVLAWDRPWGWTGAITVPGDYNGDGLNDLCVYDQNTGYWYVQTLAGTVLAWELPWGWPGATTVPGDYDADGKSDMAVYDQPSGAWYVWSQAKGQAVIWARPWGWTGAVPVPGDYDGDGYADLAVFDTITGYWYVWSEVKGVALAWAVNWGWPGANPPGGR